MLKFEMKNLIGCYRSQFLKKYGLWCRKLALMNVLPSDESPSDNDDIIYIMTYELLIINIIYSLTR